MKEKMLSGDLKNLKKCRTLAAMLLVFVMVITLTCTVACAGGGGGVPGDPSVSPSDPFDPDDSKTPAIRKIRAKSKMKKSFLKKFPRRAMLNLLMML